MVMNIRSCFLIYPLLRSCCTLQFFILFLLAFQNASVVLLMSYTQQRQLEEGMHRFSVSHAIIMQELLKAIFSLVWCVVDVYLLLNSYGFRGAEKDAFDTLQPSKIVVVSDGTTRVGRDSGSGSGLSLLKTAGVGERVMDAENEAKATAFDPPSTAEKFQLFRRRFRVELFDRSALWMALPAIIYSIQGYVLYVALQNIEPTLFQVTYQLKTIVIALFMWMFLKRTFTLRQWFSLFLLMLGVAAAQIGGQRNFNTKSTLTVVRGNYVIGILATVAAVLLSSFASVFVEALLKSKLGLNESFTSTKNVHLSFFSIICLLVVDILGAAVQKQGDTGHAFLFGVFHDYLSGFDILVWILVLLQAIGGILVALVIQYSDNIMKTFATGSAIVLSGLCSAYIYSFMPSNLFSLGLALGILAIFMYNR